uniref:Uncharacterized protein n=1 Tax=Rhizophora mucronata TaxID=61149 RepID=A0A2P2KZW3_RHIMU
MEKSQLKEKKEQPLTAKQHQLM